MDTDNAPQDNTESVETDAPEIGKPTETVEEKSNADTLYDGDNGQTDEGGKAGDEPAKESDDKSEGDSKPEDDKSEDKDDSDDESKDKSEDNTDEEYELSKPEDSLLSDADMERIASYAKEQGLSKDAAEKLVTDRDAAVKDFHQNNLDNHKVLVDKWANDCKDDKEIGGENYKESVIHAKTAIDRFATEEFKKQLNDTGFGNNPEVVRIFARIGRAMDSDSVVRGGAAQGSGKSAEHILFDKSNHN